MSLHLYVFVLSSPLSGLDSSFWVARISGIRITGYLDRTRWLGVLMLAAIVSMSRYLQSGDLYG
jgi:hypothetical protein